MKNEENIALIEQELSDFKIDRSSIKELLEVKVTTAKKLTSAEYHFCNSYRETGQRNLHE